MIKVIIIDDEEHVRNNVFQKVTTHFKNEIQVVAQADGVKSGLEAIYKHEPNLLLLDINMQDGTGFDLIEQSNYKSFDVIFITGFDSHAIKAIKVGALDYILKPLDEDELIPAINKAISNSDHDNDLEKLIQVSNEFFKGVENKRIILKTADTVYAIYEDDIIYCKSDGNYTTFYTQQMEKIVISKPLKKVEEILSEDIFIRCHQSYIVNKKHVLKYNKNGVLIVHLDFKVPVSGRRKDYTLKKIFE